MARLVVVCTTSETEARKIAAMLVSHRLNPVICDRTDILRNGDRHPLRSAHIGGGPQFPPGPSNSGKKREEAVQGRRRYARSNRQSSIPTTSRALATFSGGGSWAEPVLKTSHRRIPSERVGP